MNIDTNKLKAPVVMTCISNVMTFLCAMSSVSELLLLSAKKQLFGYINFNKLMMTSAYLDFYSASSLKQLSVGKRIISLGHIILFPSQPVFVLTPQSCCSVEKQQVPMFQSLV